MEPFLTFINTPAVQYGLTLLGGFVLKRWPSFANRLIPVATLGLNLIISVLAATFGVNPDIPPLQGALATWVAATGTHSIVKNLRQLSHT